MKRKNRSYSMSAKERKALRETNDKKNKVTIDNAIVDDNLEANTVDDAIMAKSIFNRKTLFVAGAIFLAAIMLVTAILIPLVIIPKIAYSNIDNPVAVISLSNGDKIELEIMEKEVPIAATNFLYLARKKFFNNTIIFDTTNQYMRFGQYESYSSLRSKNANFLESLTDITNAPSVAQRLSYLLADDTADSAKDIIKNIQQEGYLSTASRLSGVDFQICGFTGAQLDILPKQNSDYVEAQVMSGVAFGKVINDDSMQVVKKIGEMQRDYTSNHNYFVGTTPVLKITSVKLYNMDSAKWKRFNWSNYFTTARPNGTSAILQWLKA